MNAGTQLPFQFTGEEAVPIVRCEAKGAVRPSSLASFLNQGEARSRSRLREIASTFPSLALKVITSFNDFLFLPFWWVDQN